MRVETQIDSRWLVYNQILSTEVSVIIIPTWDSWLRAQGALMRFAGRAGPRIRPREAAELRLRSIASTSLL